jgi:Tfp pilus assembly protein PilF
MTTRVQTRLDHSRDALTEGEWQLAHLSGSGPDAMKVLHLFDRIDLELSGFGVAGLDVRAERVRYGNMQQRLRDKRDLFLAEVGTRLYEEREKIQPDHDKWWWFLDEEAASQRSRRRRLWLLGAGLLLVALVSAEFVVGPSSRERTANRRAQSGKDLAKEGDLAGALVEFGAAAEADSDDPSLWVWQGVIHHELGELEQAEMAFSRAVGMYKTELEFLVDCCMAYLDIGDLDAASVRTEQAVIQYPESADAHFVRALIANRRGDCNAAVTDYERAAELANDTGDYRLEANARLYLSTAASSCGGILGPSDANNP